MTESLAEVLRHFRAAAKLSQETLAERSGLSTRTVSDIETGAAQSPRLVTVMLLAEALGLSTEERTRLQQAARKPAGRPGRPAPAAASILQAPALVGRDADVERLSALLSRDGVRLVTLVGPAGVGKTSLATRVAAECGAAFERGAVMAELAPVEDPSLVAAAVARALGIRDSADGSASDAVTSYLRNRALLLVLDNLEHLTPAATWIGDLLSACPRVTVIATSREPLHLQLERVYAVPPLQSEAAVRLFVERAQMVKPEFELSEANSAAVDTIVDHLEGLPLAIELAAPRLLLLPPKALAARLERRLPLLGNVSVDRPERQQTMHGAIAWSYDLLAPEEQRLFRRLSVLHGGSLAAAAAVAGESGERSILFRLAPLVDKNMLFLLEDAEAEPRVAMLEMLREFAQERLAENGELANVSRLHAQYILGFAQGAARELSGSEQARWLARFELEHLNIESALGWASQNEETELGCALVAAALRFWWMGGHFISGSAWAQRFLKLRAASPDAVPKPLHAKVLRTFVVLQSALGNFDEAFEACEEAIALQRETGDEVGLGASLTSLGIVFQHRGEYDRAEEVHAEGLQIRKRLRDEAGVANSLSNLASTAFSKNELSKAATLAEESASLYRRLGNESGLAHALMKLGLVAAGEQNYSGAEDLFNECLRIQRATHDTGSTYYSVVNLGAVAYKRGDYALALARFHEALELLDTTPNKSALAKTLEHIGATIAAVGDLARGARLIAAADTLRRAIGGAVFLSERADYEAELASIRAQLGVEAFDIQWRIGASSTLERAVEEAREAINVKHGPSSQRQPVLGS